MVATQESVMVGSVNDLRPGKMKEVMVRGNPVLLARVGDSFYAAQGRCPHMGAVLANGTLDGTVVTCPRHHSMFDITTGKNLRWTD